MKASIVKTTLLACALGLSVSASAEEFGPGNHPRFFSKLAGASIDMKFERLPLGGAIKDESLIWSGSYWPSNLGGTAYRFASPYPNPFNYHLFTKEEVAKLSTGEMLELSPTELYDIANGDYTYTLTKMVLMRTSARDLWWEGINHGWAQASMNYSLPKDVTVVNPNGIAVPFSSVHVQALISLHEAYNYHGSPSAFLGKRCRVNGKVRGEEDLRDGTVVFPDPESDEANSPDCRDVNAGGFHAALTNMIGLSGKSFVADLDRYAGVSNHPIKSYKTKIVSQAEGKVTVKTTIVYAAETAPGEAQSFRQRTYDYVIELDTDGNITGGEWISDSRPDFLWAFGRKAQFVNAAMPLAGLNKIYQASEK